jgi:hypothetical protein
MREAEAARDAAELYKMPIGMVFPFAGTTAPAGSVALQGQLLSRTGYADLWAHAQTSGNMAASDGAWSKGQFSPGDGSTTFRVMDLRDRYIRGASSTRPVGLVEEDAFQGHWHEVFNSEPRYINPYGIATGGVDGWYRGTSAASLPSIAKTPLSDGINGTPRTADETRVKGIAYLWCIKAFDVISNPAILNAQSVVNQLNDKLDAAEIVAPGDAPKYVCRAWVNFDGVNITTDYGNGPNGIRGFGNVSSVVKRGTGAYTINMEEAMPDVAYATVVTGQKNDASDDGYVLGGIGTGGYTASSVQVTMQMGTSGPDNLPTINVVMFR